MATKNTKTAKTPKQEFESYMKAANEGTISDALNPGFLFSLTHTELLVKIASGEIDANVMARTMLAARGLDTKGKWVGFDKAWEGLK